MAAGAALVGVAGATALVTDSSGVLDAVAVAALPGTYFGIEVIGVMIVVNSDAHFDSTPFCKYGRKDLS